MDNNDMYQNGQPTETQPENNQFAGNNNNEYQNNYTGTNNNEHQNNYTGTNNNGYQNNYTGNNNNSSYQQYPYNNYNYNGNYQAPYQPNSPLDLEEPMKVGEWLISLLITMIPCVGIIMIFVWAFGSTEKKSKSNFFKAYLLYHLIILGIVLIYVFSIAALGVSMSSAWY